MAGRNINWGLGNFGQFQQNQNRIQDRIMQLQQQQANIEANRIKQNGNIWGGVIQQVSQAGANMVTQLGEQQEQRLQSSIDSILSQSLPKTSNSSDKSAGAIHSESAINAQAFARRREADAIMDEFRGNIFGGKKAKEEQAIALQNLAQSVKNDADIVNITKAITDKALEIEKTGASAINNPNANIISDAIVNNGYDFTTKDGVDGITVKVNGEDKFVSIDDLKNNTYNPVEKGKPIATQVKELTNNLSKKADEPWKDSNGVWHQGNRWDANDTTAVVSFVANLSDDEIARSVADFAPSALAGVPEEIASAGVSQEQWSGLSMHEKVQLVKDYKSSDGRSILRNIGEAEYLKQAKLQFQNEDKIIDDPVLKAASNRLLYNNREIDNEIKRINLKNLKDKEVKVNPVDPTKTKVLKAEKVLERANNVIAQIDAAEKDMTPEQYVRTRNEVIRANSKEFDAILDDLKEVPFKDSKGNKNSFKYIETDENDKSFIVWENGDKTPVKDRLDAIKKIKQKTETNVNNAYGVGDIQIG